MPGFRATASVAERFHLALAPDELRQSAPGRDLQPRAQRAESRNLKNFNRFVDTSDPRRSQRFKLKVSFGQPPHTLADHDRAGIGQCLQPCRQTGGMAYRRVLGMALAGLNRTDHHLPGVDPDPHLQVDAAVRAQPLSVTPHLLLHPQRRIERALGMVLVRHGGAEQREDAISGGLHDVAAIAMDRVDHQLQRRVDNGARLLGVELLHQLHRALDVSEQRRDRLALALERVAGRALRRDANLGSR